MRVGRSPFAANFHWFLNQKHRVGVNILKWRSVKIPLGMTMFRFDGLAGGEHIMLDAMLAWQPHRLEKNIRTKFKTCGGIGDHFPLVNHQIQRYRTDNSYQISQRWDALCWMELDLLFFMMYANFFLLTDYQVSHFIHNRF